MKSTITFRRHTAENDSRRFINENPIVIVHLATAFSTHCQGDVNATNRLIVIDTNDATIFLRIKVIAHCRSNVLILFSNIRL